MYAGICITHKHSLYLNYTFIHCVEILEYNFVCSIVSKNDPFVCCTVELLGSDSDSQASGSWALSCGGTTL